MQTVRSILQISSRGVRLTDEYGSQTGVDLEIMLGTAVRLEFDLRGESGADGGELAVYPAENLNNSSNYFALDSRTRNSNAPALLKYSGITLCQNADGYNIMTVELENNATEKVIESIASQENGIFRAEIGGVDSNGLTVFAWQFDISIRSRVFIGEADETITGDPAYYTAAQTITLITEQAAAISGELSAELAENMVRYFGDRPVFLALQADQAKALGYQIALRLGSSARILCIDRVKLTEGDYLDVGAPVGPALPVVIKTIILQR